MTNASVMENDVVKLRRVRPADAVPVYEAVRESIAEISPWMYWCHPDYSLADSKTWSIDCADAWEKGDAYGFVVEGHSDRLILGVCGLNQINSIDRLANLGYWVRTSRTRQGIATAVVPLIARFGFEELNLNRVEIVVATANLPSQRVAEKAGAFREGVLRHRIMVRETLYNAIMFSLVPENFT